MTYLVLVFREILFALSFEDSAVRTGHTEHNLPKVGMKEHFKEQYKMIVIDYK